MAWLDNSGLYQKYGLEQTVTQAGGEYRTNAELREIEFKIDLTALTTTPTIVTGADNIFFPAGVRIEQVEIVADTAATSGGLATLDIGLQRTDRSTEIDYDGIIKVFTLASVDAIGEKNTITATTATFPGALFTAGTVGSNPGYITMNYTTAAFTAGILTIRIKYRKV